MYSQIMQNDKQLSFQDTSVAFSSKTDQELEKMHFLFSTMNRKYPVKIGTFFIKAALKFKFPVQSLVRNTLFKQFCGGETIEECKKVILELIKFNIHTILDYCIEGKNTDESFENTKAEVLETINKASVSPAIAFGVFKISAIGPAEVLEKVQNGETLTPKELAAFDKLKERADFICRTAWEKKVKVLVDAEESWIQDITDVIVYELMKKYNHESAIVYNTFQMYREDMMYNLEKAYELANEDKFFLGVKLVRGAYMKKELLRARERGYKYPLFSTKEETDHAYDNALLFCMQHLNKIFLCAGTHNEKSNYYLTSLMMKYKIQNNDSRIYFSQLYGMSDHISYNLSACSYNVAKYLPFGPMDAVMPYLFRRAEENQSVLGQTSRELLLVKKEISRRKKLKK
jgi:proline dehydrogenase